MTQKLNDNAHKSHANPAQEDMSAKAIDPVCGMSVDPAKTAHHAHHQGKEYHFCCNGCRTKFEANPEKYIAAQAGHEGHSHDPAKVVDPVCGMTVDPAKDAASCALPWQGIPFLRQRLPHQVRGGSGKIPQAEGGASCGSRAGRHDIHLPDAPGD